MPHTPYQQNAKPLQIVTGCKAVENLNIAVIAGCSSEVEDPQGLFEAIIFKTHDYVF